MGTISLGRSAAFLYIENITLMLPGYLYWLVLSRLVSQDAIGSFSTVVSLSAITSNIIMLGIPIGCQRFISKSLSEGKDAEIKLLVQSSLIILTVAAIAWSVFMISFDNFISASLNLSSFLILFLIVHTCSTAYYMLLRGFVISTLDTRIIATTTILATGIRFVSAIAIILLGQPYLGIATGILLLPLIGCLFLGLDVFRLVRRRQVNFGIGIRPLFRSGKEVITASIAGWIPSLITLIGTNLGIVVVNSFQGPYHAAIYFIAFAIISAVLGISSVFFSIGYPVLSAMKDGRKRSTVGMIKLCLTIVIPITFSMLFYSRDVMGLFGESYSQGWIELSLLLLSVFPVTLSGFMTILSYSYGKYKETLLIGIASTLPRVILYILLVPILGTEGAAFSYLMGSWIGLIPALLFARNIRLQLNWQTYLGISLTPLLVSFTLATLHLPLGFGVLGTLLITYVLFLYLKILDRNDAAQLLTMLPTSFQKHALTELGYRLAKKINRSF